MIQIDNKFNVGDVVFFISISTLGCYIIKQGEVVSIKLENGALRYKVTDADLCGEKELREQEVFSNGEELRQEYKRRALEKYNDILQQIEKLSLWSL